MAIRQLKNKLPFEVLGMANVGRKRTGLPVTVWISQGTGLPYGPRVKANCEPGDLAPSEKIFIVSIESEPKILLGKPAKKEYATKVREWVSLNKALLLSYWSGESWETSEVLNALKPLKE